MINLIDVLSERAYPGFNHLSPTYAAIAAVTFLSLGRDVPEDVKRSLGAQAQKNIEGFIELKTHGVISNPPDPFFSELLISAIIIDEELRFKEDARTMHDLIASGLDTIGGLIVYANFQINKVQLNG